MSEPEALLRVFMPVAGLFPFGLGGYEAATEDRTPFLLVSLFLMGSGLYVFLKIRRRRNMSQSHPDWPIVVGTVIETWVRNISSEGGEAYSAMAKFRYLVADHEFIRKVEIGTKESEGLAREALRKLRMGAGIMVHYNPRNPAESYTDYSSGSEFFLLLYGILAFLIGLAFFCAAVF
jgi:hypothetical protein